MPAVADSEARSTMEEVLARCGRRLLASLKHEPSSMGLDPRQYAAAREAKSKAKELLKDVTQVSGIGITQVGEQYAIKVNLLEEPSEPHAIPTDIDGVPVVVHRTGKVHKQGSAP